MDYNQRTARTIEAWAARFNCRLLHHRILHEVFRQAWREEYQKYPANVNHLRNTRRFRSREWWSGTQQIPWRSRRDLGLMHATPGGSNDWEDIFVLVYGLGWRSFRDQFGNEREWMANFDFFANAVCTEWGLPLPPSKTRAVQIPDQSSKRRRLQGHVLDELPHTHAEDGRDMDCSWGDARMQVLFVVDCQPLQRIVCGHAPCLNPGALHLIDRTCDNLAALVLSGWLPAERWRDPVTWRRRNYNVIADHLVNYTMDVRQTWSLEFDWPHPSRALHDCNLIAHTDGGARGRDCAASAWIIEEVVFGGGDRHKLAMGGTFLESWTDSFSAEAAALSECTTVVRRLVERLAHA